MDVPSRRSWTTCGSWLGCRFHLMLAVVTESSWRTAILFLEVVFFCVLLIHIRWNWSQNSVCGPFSCDLLSCILTEKSQKHTKCQNEIRTWRRRDDEICLVNCSTLWSLQCFRRDGFMRHWAPLCLRGSLQNTNRTTGFGPKLKLRLWAALINCCWSAGGTIDDISQ